METQTQAQFRSTPRLSSGLYSPLRILEWVLARVKEEPKRLDMRYWLSSYRGNYIYDSNLDLPACGTVACLSGWIGLGLGSSNWKDLSYGVTLRALGLDVYSGPGQDFRRLFLRAGAEREDAIEQFEALINQHREVLAAMPLVEVK